MQLLLIAVVVLIKTNKARGLGMLKVNKHIEIVSSSIIELSSMSKVSRDAVRAALGKYYDKVGISIVDNIADLEKLVAKSPDLVFLGMKSIPRTEGHGGNRIWIADYLADRGIATTGSPSLAHKIEVNKPLAKKCLLHDGISTADYYVHRAGQLLTPEMIPIDYPIFVKPSDRGGGVGIDSDSVVNDFSELSEKVRSITANFKSNSLIESYLPGREFSVAILRDDSSEGGYMVMPIELIAPEAKAGIRVLGSETKEADTEVRKKITDTVIKESVSNLAINAFRSIGGRDYGRIDIRMDEFGVPQFLEANLIPSLIDNYGSFPKACALNVNLRYEDMLLRIVELGLKRASMISSVLQSSAVLGSTRFQAVSAN